MENIDIKTYKLSHEEIIIIDELLVQMSDGWFENDDSYNKYWMNFDTDRKKDTLTVYKKNIDGYEEAEENPLFGLSIGEILHFFEEVIDYDDRFLVFMIRNLNERHNNISKERLDYILNAWENLETIAAKDWKSELLKAIRRGDISTDSDVEDFASERCLDEGDVFKFIATKQTEGTKCEGCKYVMMRFGMYPCNSCVRNCNIKDYYCQKGEGK